MSYCYWGVTTQQTELGNVCILTQVYRHYMYFSVCLSIYILKSVSHTGVLNSSTVTQGLSYPSLLFITSFYNYLYVY